MHKNENKIKSITASEQYAPVTEDDTRPELPVYDYAFEIFVAPDGRDDGKGTIKDPLRTMKGARDYIRRLRASKEDFTGGIAVNFRGGIYPLNSTLNLTSEDSGTADCPIEYRAYNDETPVLEGAIDLNAEDFKPLDSDMKKRLRNESARENVVVCDLTKYDYRDLGPLLDPNVNGAELYIGKKRMCVCRYPSMGKDVVIKEVIRHETDPAHHVILRLDDEEYKTWGSYNDIFLCGFFRFDWSYGLSRLNGVTENGLVDAGPHDYAGGGHFYFYNVFDELSQPGEYCIDRENKLLYVYKTDNFETAQIQLSCCPETPLVLENVNYFTFRGFTIEGTRGKIAMIKGDHIIFDRNHILMGMHLMDMTGKYCIFSNNHVEQMGGRGIFLYSGSYDTLESGHSFIYNNLFHDWGQVNKAYHPAMKTTGNGDVMSHNVMYNCSHEAVEYNGNELMFAYNIIHDVCNETGDAGAVYIGRRWDWNNNVVKFNYIYNIINRLLGGAPRALYYDDTCSGQVVYGNIIQDPQGFTIHCGGGRDMEIRNNILIGSQNGGLGYDSRAAGINWQTDLATFNTGYVWTNIEAHPYLSKLWMNSFPVLSYRQPNTDVGTARRNFDTGGNISYSVIRNNVLIGTPSIGGSNLLTVYSTVRDNVTYSDPSVVGFKDFENRDMTLTEDSPVFYDLPGFVSIPFDEIGFVKE